MNTITAHVEIHPEQLASALSPATLAKALFEKLTAPAEVGTATPTKASTPPPIGAMWPEQGGIYAGVMRGEWGHNYHLIIAPHQRPQRPEQQPRNPRLRQVHRQAFSGRQPCPQPHGQWLQRLVSPRSP